MPSLTVEQILNGTGLGRPQSVGQMEVVPILDDGGAASDQMFAPPRFRAGTRGYSQVQVHNTSRDRPTIVPTGAGFITTQAAQDHAVAGAHFVGPNEDKVIDRAMCIQQTQGGLIRQSEDTLMVVLPATLRAKALAQRADDTLGRLWTPIADFNRSMGVVGSGDLVKFLTQYQKELDEFVAEFEIVPGMIGAIVLINGQVVGIERAPNPEFWQALWQPLIRVCYGSLALKARKLLGDRPPPTRTVLDVSQREKSLAGIAEALKDSRLRAAKLLGDEVGRVKAMPLVVSGKGAEGRLQRYEILTVANSLLAGQVITNPTVPGTSYVSLCASGA